MIEAIEAVAGPWAALAVALAVGLAAVAGALGLLAGLSWGAAHEERAHDWRRRGGHRYGAEWRPLTRCPPGLAAFGPRPKGPPPDAPES